MNHDARFSIFGDRPSTSLEMQMELLVRAVFYIVRPARRRGARRLRVVSLSRLGVTVASSCCIRIVGGINRSQSPKGFYRSESLCRSHFGLNLALKSATLKVSFDFTRPGRGHGVGAGHGVQDQALRMFQELNLTRKVCLHLL